LALVEEAAKQASVFSLRLDKELLWLGDGDGLLAGLAGDGCHRRSWGGPAIVELGADGRERLVAVEEVGMGRVDVVFLGLDDVGDEFASGLKCLVFGII